MDENQKVTGSENQKSRRSFIKKTSVVAGISVLPVSNVWGACNVSGVSGGSQSTDTTCVVDHFSGGRPPGTWRTLINHNPSSDDVEAVAKIIRGVGKTAEFKVSKQLKVAYYYPLVATFITNKEIILAGGGDIPSAHFNVGAALNNYSNSADKVDQLKYHLAAVYLNGLFGWNVLPAEFSGSDGLELFIVHSWGSAFVGDASQVQSALSSSYNDNRNSRVSEAELVEILKK